MISLCVSSNYRRKKTTPKENGPGRKRIHGVCVSGRGGGGGEGGGGGGGGRRKRLSV